MLSVPRVDDDRHATEPPRQSADQVRSRIVRVQDMRLQFPQTTRGRLDTGHRASAVHIETLHRHPNRLKRRPELSDLPQTKDPCRESIMIGGPNEVVDHLLEPPDIQRQYEMYDMDFLSGGMIGHPSRVNCYAFHQRHQLAITTALGRDRSATWPATDVPV